MTVHGQKETETGQNGGGGAQGLASMAEAKRIRPSENIEQKTCPAIPDKGLDKRVTMRGNSI